MSMWRGKALELFPEMREQIQSTKDRQQLWHEIERAFHDAKSRSDDSKTARCLRYAIWTLHPTPQAQTMSDVSGPAARLLHRYAGELHCWIDRYDFMQAQKGLKLHLGQVAYDEFESRFLEKTRDYPRRKKSNQSVQKTD